MTKLTLEDMQKTIDMMHANAAKRRPMPIRVRMSQATFNRAMKTFSRVLDPNRARFYGLPVVIDESVAVVEIDYEEDE